MKVFLTSLIILFTVLVVFFSNEVITYSAAPPISMTGAPGEGSCANVYCHGGGNVVNNMITTNIPSTGYVEGQTYQVTVTVSDPASQKFGFEITAMSGTNYVGKFLADTSLMTIMDSGRYVGHKTPNHAGNMSKSWTFQWTAPFSGLDSITFYVAGNATNSDSTYNGDHIYLSSVTFNKDLSSGVDNASLTSFIKLYPNPLQVNQSLKVEGLNTGNTSIKMSDISGKTVYEKQVISSGILTIDPNLPKGIYMLSIVNAGKKMEKQLVIY